MPLKAAGCQGMCSEPEVTVIQTGIWSREKEMDK